MRRLLTVALLACAALATIVTPAQAHSPWHSVSQWHNVLIGSDPASGARLASPPRQVRLSFDQAVRPDFVRVVVTGPDGVSTPGVVSVEGNDVIAALPALTASGHYIIGYRIVSNDGHPVTGAVPFSVGQEGEGAFTTVAMKHDSRSPAGTAVLWTGSVVVLAFGGFVLLRRSRRRRAEKSA